MSNLDNLEITRKQVQPKQESDKLTVPLPTVRANLVLGKDKGGELGLMIPWARLSKADSSITDLREYLTAMARDLAQAAQTLK